MLFQRLSSELAKKIDIPLVPERWEDDLINKLLEKIVIKYLLSERKHKASYLSPDMQKDLRRFVEKTLVKKIEQELFLNNDTLSEFELNFVFGHTHKPFASLENLLPLRVGLKFIILVVGW